MDLDTEWTAMPTGDMTIAVVATDGTRIVKIDMLADNTMKAGDGGKKLARRLNDLYIISKMPKLAAKQKIEIALPYTDGAVSCFPWNLEILSDKRRIKISDCKKKKICGNQFGKTYNEEKLEGIIELLERGIKAANQIYGDLFLI